MVEGVVCVYEIGRLVHFFGILLCGDLQWFRIGPSEWMR